MENNINVRAAQLMKAALGEYQFRAIINAAEIDELKARVKQLEAEETPDKD